MGKGTSLKAEATLQTCICSEDRRTHSSSARFQEAQGAHAGPAPPGRDQLTSSPKVGEGPQLIVLSSAATMMLLFLQRAAAVTPASSSPALHPTNPAAPGASMGSLQGANLPA